MKKTFKRTLATLLVAVMLLGSAPLAELNLSEFNLFGMKAEAARYNGDCGDNATWTFASSAGVLTISGTGDMYGWPGDDPEWYSFKTEIESVVINNGITSIGAWAFYDCNNLTSVTIPDSVTTIGDGAFGYCFALQSVTIPDSVTAIGDWAFEDCDSLASVIIPDSVKTIGDGAFNDCDSLTSVTIPQSVTTIGKYVFDCCNSLTKITVSAANADYLSDEYGVLFNKDKTELIQYPVGNTRTAYAIPDSVKIIGDSAFSLCDSLTIITIPDSVITISGSAFSFCESLTNVTIPDSVKNIGNWAFEGCTDLASITLSDTVTSIDSDAFNDTALYDNVSNWKNGVLYIGNHLIKAKDTVSGAYEIKSGTKTIAGEAFSCCESLTRITIPNSVVSIGDWAFDECYNLTSVTIPDSVERIGFCAFDGSGIYTNPSNWEDDVLYIGNHLIAVDYCVTGKYVVKQGTKTIADCAFGGCFGITNVVIPEGVKSIGEDAFEFCYSLKTVIIPESVKYIGKWAFDDCGNLTYIGYAGTEEKWNEIEIDSDNGYLFATEVIFSFDTGFEIRKPSVTTIVYGDRIILHADYDKELPEGAYIVWAANNGSFSLSPSEDGMSCTVSPQKRGNTVISATMYDESGKILSFDMQEMTAKVNFIYKLIAFFKNIFGLIKVIPQAMFGIKF